MYRWWYWCTKRNIFSKRALRKSNQIIFLLKHLFGIEKFASKPQSDLIPFHLIHFANYKMCNSYKIATDYRAPYTLLYVNGSEKFYKSTFWSIQLKIEIYILNKQLDASVQCSVKYQSFQNPSSHVVPSISMKICDDDFLSFEMPKNKA